MDQFGGQLKNYGVKPKIKIFLLSIVCLGLIFGSLFVFKKSPSVASYSLYQSLKIAPSSLNGNSIWGGGETFNTVVKAGGLDDWAAFYSATNRASGGLDPSGAMSVDGVPYQFSWTGTSDYTGNDTIRLLSGHTSATITLDTIGAYDKLYVLGTAGGPGEGNFANFAVVVHYTDGTYDETDYRLYDWYDATPVDGVYKWSYPARRLVVTSGNSHSSNPTYNYEGTTTGAPYLQSATIEVDAKKLVSSVDLVMTGRNDTSTVQGIFSGIYAVTGMVNVAAPGPVEVIYVDRVSDTTADIHWDAVAGATSYRLDIALDPDFKNILTDYNNLYVQDVSLVATGLNSDTQYYTRVRAENSEGQSISSNVVGFRTLPETTPPTVSIIANPGVIQIKDDAVIIGIDASGVKAIEESLDGGETWTTIADGDRAEREITENGTYCYRAIDNYDNVSEPNCITYSNLDTAKPVIRINTNGYVEGSWTNQIVTLTVESLTINVGQTRYFYSEDGENWLDYNESVIVTEETGLDGKVYYFKAISAAGVESDVVSALVRRDITAPTGEISSSDNSWNSFLNTITFGLFFNDTKNFTIDTDDNLSGVATVEYLITPTAFENKEDALNASGWQTVNDSVAIDPEGDFVLYYKITDNAGNVSVINTEGVILDATNALIEGYVDADHTYPLEDGKTYYLTQKIIVTDDRALENVTVNGVVAESNLIDLTANQTYAIVATDKAGNVSTLTIKTGSLNDLNLDITDDNFKTTDEDRLEEAIEKLVEIETEEGSHASEEEIQIIEDLIEKYEDLLDKIEDLKNEVETEVQNSSETSSVDEVTSEDRDTIAEILDEINETLDEDGGHLSIEEVNELLIEKTELEEKLNRIDEVAEDLEDLEIVEHTSTDIIKTEDKEELEDLKETGEALLESDNLTDEEREKVEEELAIIDELLEQIEDAITAINTDDIHAIDDIIPTGYTIDDKDELEAAKEDLEQALEEYGNNYTDSEKEEIEEKINAINDALEDIDNQIWEEIRRTTFPTINVTSETERWIVQDVAGISATDDYGVDKLEVSRDGGETWTLITELESGTYDVLENGTYIFQATNEFGNTARKTVVYHNIDPVKPVVEVDSHGYVLGTWTNQPITLTERNIANNISPVTLYYRPVSTSDGGSDWLTYTNSVLVLEDTDAVAYEFKAVSAAGLESDAVTAVVKKDSVVPAGTISEGEDSVNSFLNSITFGLLFNETKTYEMAATDDRSGIDTIEYIVSESEMTDDELKAATNWTATGGVVSVDPDKTVNVYYRLTDNAGNVSVVSLNGVVFELPGLSEVDVTIEAGESGYSTITSGLGSMTLINDLEHTTVDDLDELKDARDELSDYLENHNDGSANVVSNVLADYLETIQEIEQLENNIDLIEESYEALPPFEETTTDIEDAVDAIIDAIEETEATYGNHLTTDERQELDDMLDDLNNRKELIEEIESAIEDIDDRIDEYDIDTVNKDDLPALNDLEDDVNDLIDNYNLTDDEQEHMDDVLEEIERLKERIEEVEKAIEEAKEKDQAGDITPDNVTPEDQTTLEDAADAYAEALGVFDSNLSLEDLFLINNKVSAINSALDVLDQVAEFEAMISRLPNPEEVNFNSRLIIKAAESAYNALSEYGRTLVGPSLLAKYRAVIEAYRAYLEGSPLLYAFETLDVFWWALSTLFIVGAFVTITRHTHKRYVEVNEDSDDF